MKISVTYKIAFIYIITIAVIFSGIFLYLNNILTDYTYKRIKSNLLKQLNLSASILETTKGVDYRSYAMDNLAETIGKAADVRVTIIALDGRVYGDSSLDERELYSIENHLKRPEVQDALNRGIGYSERFSTTLKTDKLYIAKTFGKQKAEGIIRLAVPLSDVKTISDRLKHLLIGLFAFAFALSIVLFFLVSSWISKPIKDISWFAKNIARGDFSKYPVHSGSDEIGELAGSIRFMSEQIRSKIDEVTTNKARLEAVFLSMFEGVMVIDQKSRIVIVNKALRDLLSIEGNVEGRNAIEVIRNAEIQDAADSVLKMKTGVLSKEIIVLDTTEKHILLHAVPVVRGGINEAAVLVFHDITELRRLERIRRDFTANVSHELRTPVSNIQGYAETLLQGALNDRKNAGEFIEIILSESKRLAGLINDILDLSKIESGEAGLQLDRNSLRGMVENVYKITSRNIKEKHIDFIVDIADTAEYVFCDRAKIEQVLYNLIDNAVKYTDKKGAIKISSREQDNFIRIDVTDSGIGIAEEHIPRIFERFYRVDKARSRELEGTGLGLAIVKHIVQSHTGEVQVKSSPFKGSTFSFTLPSR